MPTSIEHIKESITPNKREGDRKRVLVCAGHYLPGYKSGGPIRSISNMITNLGAYFDFYVMTRDRDLADVSSYPDIRPNNWYRVGNAQVLYCSSVSLDICRHVFQEVRPDIINLNSFQDSFTRTMAILRHRGEFGSTPVILAPRGEFSLEAMKIKKAKKILYRHATKLIGLYDNILWKVSTPREKADLLQAAPTRALNPASIYVTYEISDAIASLAPCMEKNIGSVKLAFAARISEIKNLHFLLKVLHDIQGKVQLDIFGPVAEKDAAYWEKCRKAMMRLPDHIKAEYKGPLEHSVIPHVLNAHHFFVLPTRGENFCHSAVESFVNGTPVVLSDATPWIHLEDMHAGFDIPLNDRGGWVAAIQKCVDMDQHTYASNVRGAREYGKRFSLEGAVRQHLAMFYSALSPVIKSHYGVIN